MADSAAEPRPAAHTGPLDFSETAHGMVQRIIAKADPDAGLDAEDTAADVALRRKDRREHHSL